VGSSRLHRTKAPGASTSFTRPILPDRTRDRDEVAHNTPTS